MILNFIFKYFFISLIKFFITFNQIYKTNSEIKHNKHKTIYKLYTRLYLVIYFSLTYKFARYHRWNREKQLSKGCSVKKIPKKSRKIHRNKHPHQNLPFNKAAGQRPATLLKNRPWHRALPRIPQNPREHFNRASPVQQSISGCCLRTDKKEMASILDKTLCLNTYLTRASF